MGRFTQTAKHRPHLERFNTAQSDPGILYQSFSLETSALDQ